MLRRWKRTLALLGLVAATGLVCAAVAAAEKPAPPPPPQPQPTVRYEITFLGWFDGDVSSYTRDVNNFGDVVGSSRSADNVNRACLWTQSGGMVDLNELISDEDKANWHLGSPTSINDFGQIAGVGRFNGDKRAFRFTPGYTDEEGYHAPVVENLGALGGYLSIAGGINNWGEVSGVVYYATELAERAFLYIDADGDGTQEMIDIGDLGGGHAHGAGINNSGQVTGYSDTAAKDSGGHAFRYTPGVAGLPGVMEDLAPLVETSGGRGINDNGHVVGSARAGKVRGISVSHAFLYTDEDGLIDLGTLGGYWSEAKDVNFHDEVVGNAAESTEGGVFDNPQHGFLYTNKTDTGGSAMFKLQDLLVNPEDVQGPIMACEINDRGEICGFADGQAILLRPVTP